MIMDVLNELLTGICFCPFRSQLPSCCRSHLMRLNFESSEVGWTTRPIHKISTAFDQ